jgi:hypothetical protein
MKLRTIPEKGNSLISLFKGKGEMTIKEYEDMMLDIELRTEKKIITMLDMIGTVASVKSDRYSLPYTKQIKRSNQITSYVNEALYTQTLLRDIAKVILDENIQKIRFFVFAEIEGGMFGRVNYYFNYYIH